MPDIVWKLRESATLMLEAADEIERLRKRLGLATVEPFNSRSMFNPKVHISE